MGQSLEQVWVAVSGGCEGWLESVAFCLGIADLSGEFGEPSLDAMAERSPCLEVEFGVVLVGVFQLFEELALPSLQDIYALLQFGPAARGFVAVVAVRVGRQVGFE